MGNGLVVGRRIRVVLSSLGLLPARMATLGPRAPLRTDLLSAHLLRDLGLMDGRPTAEATRGAADAHSR